MPSASAYIVLNSNKCMELLSERELIDLYLQRTSPTSEQAINVLWKRHKNLVPSAVEFYRHRFDFKRFFDTDDLIQEASAAVLKEIFRFNPGKSTFTTFVYLVVRSRLQGLAKVVRAECRDWSLQVGIDDLLPNNEHRTYADILPDRTVHLPVSRLIRDEMREVIRGKIERNLAPRTLDIFESMLQEFEVDEDPVMQNSTSAAPHGPPCATKSGSISGNCPNTEN